MGDIGTTGSAAGLVIERLALEALVPYARNARTHSDAQVAQIAASIREFGFCNPVLIDAAGGIIAGHGRVLAARQLGLGEVPCIRLGHLTEVQRRAYVIADNKLALNAGWDEDLLALELSALRIEDFDLGLTGFDPGELDGLLDGLGLDGERTDGDTEPQIDRAEELRKQWGVETGQLWQLGEHRLLCGDSTKAEDVARVMAGERADLCLTDPPYGLGDTASDKNNYDQYDDSRDNLIKLIEGFMPIARDVCAVVVLTPGNRNQRLYPPPTWTMAWFTPAGVKRSPWGFICWQPIMCFGKDPKLAKGLGSHPDAIVHTESAEKLGHPCSKPIHFWEWLMNRTSEECAVLFEPFSGSGTTIIACENLNRRCRAIEISPGYVAVALQRWADHTGRTPVLCNV
jgi:ParB-like chromosome segregation protein Spo0J